MNLFVRILSPRLSKAISRLARTVGLNSPANHHTNHYQDTIMSSLTASEEIEIIESAIGVIVNQKNALADAVQALTPLSNANLALRDVIRSLESEDAASDAALVRLRELLPQGESPETPAEEPVTGSIGNLPVGEPVTGEPITETPAAE